MTHSNTNMYKAIGLASEDRKHNEDGVNQWTNK